MYWLHVFLTLTLATESLFQSVIHELTTEEDTVEYDYGDYNSYPRYGPQFGPALFSNPGEVVEGVTMEEIVQTFGDGWNARNLLQSANIACSRLGAVLEDVLNQLGQPGIVGTVCESFEKGNVDEACGRVWDLATNGDAGSISVIHRLYCRERDEDNEIYNYKYNGSEIEKELLRKVESYDLYDPCSETGIKKANSFVFALMDWLGPDAYVSVNRGEIDPNSACDILRYLLSLDTAEYFVQFSSILSYPVADILESFQTFDICAISQIDFDRIIAIRAAKEILVEYSGLKGIEFCDFIAKPQTREAYLELGETIVRNAFHTLVDEETCNDVLTIIAPLDKEGLHVNITGFNLTIASERAMFCAKASQAYSPNSGYLPIPYKLPEGVELDDLRPFETPGVFLPGLTFIDLLEIEGASNHAEKIIDGLAIYCRVFEEFLSAVVEKEKLDVKRLCHSFKSRDTAGIEDICLSFSYPDRVLTGLRPFDFIPVFIYIARELFGFADVSKSELCPALDYSFNQLSLRHVIETSIDIFLAEATPSINGICENWEEAKCKWNPYCPLPERRERPPKVEATTFSPFYYRPYIPSPEEVAAANAEFEEKFSIVLSLVLTIFGIDNREELCEVVAENIDPLSGRSDRTIAGNLRSNILDIFTDVEQCSEAVDKIVNLISHIDLVEDLTIYQLSGYQSSEDFCQTIADAFNTEMTESTPANDELSGTYNIFAKIAIYIQRVARSV
ncbi:uncharacterized protein [Apostichopus japonicus]|uniref:uncharacterized protein n=1 Tax=Stichopus japonicus TaxID=307972 RepID=UPI003AB4CDDC